MPLHKPPNDERLVLAGDDSGLTYEPFNLRWTDDWGTGTPKWDIHRTTTNNLVVYNHETQRNEAWFDATGTFHVQQISIEGESFADAGTLDGLSSEQFLRSDADDTMSASLDVTGTLTRNGNAVLTTADEGALDAGTLGGATLADTRPTITDDSVVVHESPATLDFGEFLAATDNADGSVTLASTGGNAVGTIVTQSGDGTATTYTLTHNLPSTPEAADVTPASTDANAPFYLSAVRAHDLDITYTSAPPSGTDNLEWHVTVTGNDGTSRQTIGVADNGTDIGLMDGLNFADGLRATDSGDSTARVDWTTTISDDNTVVQTAPTDINLGENLTATAAGNGVTLTGSDTYPSVSDDGTVVEAAPGDISAGSNLTAVADGDGTVTFNATVPDTNNADTLDNLDSTQFLRSDTSDTHTGTLYLSTVDGANANGNVSLASHIEPSAGVGLRHTTTGAEHGVYPRRGNLTSLAGGGSLPEAYGTAIEADAVVAFIETDNDVVTGWVDVNNQSMTLGGGVRVGDRGGPPSSGVALDVRGPSQFFNTANFAGNPVENFVVEQRTTDPSSPATGRMWVRTDL